MKISVVDPGVGSGVVGVAFFDGAQIIKVERWIPRQRVSNLTTCAPPSAIGCPMGRSIYPTINDGEPELIDRPQPKISWAGDI